MIVTLLVTLIFFVYIYFRFKRRRYVELGNCFPGPKTVPLIGNGLSFLNKSPEVMFEKLLNYHHKYGQEYRLWFGTDLWLIISNPKQIEGILTSQIGKSHDYNFLKPWLGNGLLLSEGKKWFQHRKILTPAFHFNILEEFVEIFDLQSNIMVDQLKRKSELDSIDIVPYIELCTLDIICETAMGTSIDAQRNKNSEYLNAVHNAALITYIRIFDTLAQFDFYFEMTKNAKIFRKSTKILHDFTDNVILKRREELLKTTKENEIVQNNENSKKKMALLDILLQSSIDGEPLTNEAIRDEVSTFMFAGHDTTSSGISFVLYNIAKYADIQQKIFEEITQVIGQCADNRVTYRNLTELKYLELVIKESLRLFPSAPYIGRQILEETVINGITYPAGSNISIAVFLMHRDPNIFPDPEKFIPERFETERTTTNFNPFSYIPFSGGSRNCIGQKFAMLEIKAVTVNILRNFKINLADKNEKLILLSKLILKSKNGIKLIFEKR